MGVRSMRNWPSGPAYDAVALTPDDNTDLATPCDALYIGATGNVKLITHKGTTTTLVAVPVGVLPVGATRVFATNTTASSIVALYSWH